MGKEEKEEEKKEEEKGGGLKGRGEGNGETDRRQKGETL